MFLDTSTQPINLRSSYFYDMNTLAINPICLGIPTCSLILQTLKCIWTTNHPQQNKLINYPYAIYAIFRKFISMLMHRTILFWPMCFWTKNQPQQNKQITYPRAIYAIVRMYVFFPCRCFKHFSGQCNGRPCQSFLFTFYFPLLFQS